MRNSLGSLSATPTPCHRSPLRGSRFHVRLAILLIGIAATSFVGRPAPKLAQGCQMEVEGRGAETEVAAFVGRYCLDCHDAQQAEAGIDLSRFESLTTAEGFPIWLRAWEQMDRGSMPPEAAEQPDHALRTRMANELRETLLTAETRERAARPGPLRRMTRYEYENAMRDLFDLPGLSLAERLPPDGSAHGFDKTADSLDLSHVTLSKYVEAAEIVLEHAIATTPEPPTIHRRRISLVNRGGFVAHVVGNGDGVLLRDGQPDPDYPAAAEQNHLDEGVHERMGSYQSGSTVGLFRHEDESFSPYFIEHVTIYPGRYRLRTSLWSFQWDRGQVLPARRTEVARLSIVQLTGDGRGGQHPSNVLGYFDAPSLEPLEHEMVVWLNRNEMIGFNTASLAPVANYSRPGRAMAFTGPGIACDWLEVEGPLHEQWPPMGHRLLFSDLPLRPFDESAGRRPPSRPVHRQLGAAMNRPDPTTGIWTVTSEQPDSDARRLLGQALPRLMRRPVSDALIEQYFSIFRRRFDEGDCFETAMRAAYLAALCSPDFLYHLDTDPESAWREESADDAATLDDWGLANRLSYLLWNSVPDERLARLAASGQLRDPAVLHGEVERMLVDARSERFLEDFVGQWLKLRQIAATDPDRKLYPEFSPYLQDAMVAETWAYVRRLLEENREIGELVDADWVMVNDVLARHYGLESVTGTSLRPLGTDADCPRGGLQTQGAILKVTANGTTTSPVPRGAFVWERLLGHAPLPPPSSVPAIEPDVRGATTIREQLARHRADPTCSACHRGMDAPGFGLEAFDVIGGYRDRYRSIGEGDPAERGAIDPFIGIGFRLGPTVDATGEWMDGRPFSGPRDLARLLSEQREALTRNLVRQLLVYATGRPMGLAERAEVDRIVDSTLAAGGGVRDLLHGVIGSTLFHESGETLDVPDGF
ncbi:MAG: DUF1592 domain-containing protein, partial [Planctomycetales bacterium]|nr:DUF1592 domain-containing protein [Planctomycetales bacterium]